MIKLILIFFYVGLFTVGGGMVAIPLIQQEVVEQNLISLNEFYEMVAVAESTPGPIGINIATYVGFSQYGILGSILVTIGFIIPSFIIVSVLHKLLSKYREKPLVQNWLLFIKAAVVGLIGYALVSVAEFGLVDSTHHIDYKSMILLVVLSVLFYFLRKKPWMVIIAGAILGIIVL
jgi:chromate transporter